MRHASLGDHFHAQRSLRRECDAVLGGLAIHQKSAAIAETRGIFIGHLRAQAVALFAHHEQQSNVNSLLAQSFRSRDLRGDDALRIARPAAVNAPRIFRRRNERRNRIHVRGKDHLRMRTAPAMWHTR